MEEKDKEVKEQVNIEKVKDNQIPDSETIDDQKPKYKVAMIIITIATLLISIYGKLMTIGWMTVLLIWTGLPIAHFALFTMSGINVANKQNKTIKDYIYFAILCISLILFTFTFVDVGDTGTNAITTKINSNILSKICIVSLVVNIFAAIKCWDKKIKPNKKETENVK